MLTDHPYLYRLAAEHLRRLFRQFPVVVVSGARQVGKSTLLENTFPGTQRIVFDPLIDLENARADPDLFLHNRGAPLILDEIQYAPELVPALKRRLDRDRRAGQYLVTGSQQWEVMKLLRESLAGRAILIDLHGFCLAEIYGEKAWLPAWLEGHDRFKRMPTRRTLFEHLWRGFFPEAQFIDELSVANFYQSYIATYINKDARQLAEVDDWTLFDRFYRLCGALTAREVNRSELGRDIGVTPQTAARWLEILKATFQWREIPAFSRNAVKRVSLKPKGYFLDSGLACFALGISSPRAVASHPNWGGIFETAVINELVKQISLMSPPPVLSHWRVHGGSEIDLILEWNGAHYPVEIKAKSHPVKSDANAIRVFRQTYKKLRVAKGLIIAPCESYYPVSDAVAVMPWDAVPA